MAVLCNNVIAGASIADDAAGGDAYQIKNSLKFNSADSAYLSSTPSSIGNRKAWTWSGWVKRTNLGAFERIFAQGSSGTVRLYASFDSDDRFQVRSQGGSNVFNQVTDHKFRDLSAFYHIVVALDCNQSAAAERCRMYVNGERIINWNTNDQPGTNDANLNTTDAFNIGRANAHSGSGSFANCYLADVRFVDGLQLSPAAFGSFDSTGVWNPKAFALPAPNANTTWSDSVSGTHNSSNDKTKAFDGLLTTKCTPGDGETMTFTPSSTITASSQIRCYIYHKGDSNWAVNGINQTGETNAADQWFTLSERTIETLTWSRTNSNNQTKIYAIEVDGVILVDGQTDPTTRNNLNDGRVWSDTGFSVTGGSYYDSNRGPAAMFDGDFASETLAPDGQTITWKPGLTGSKIEVLIKINTGNGTGSVFTNNGTSVKADALAKLGAGNQGWYNVGSSIDSSSGMTWSRVGSQDDAEISAVRVDGHMLLDSTVDNSFHLKFNDTSSNARLGRNSIGTNVSVGDATGGLPIYNTTADSDGYDDGSVKGSGNRTDTLNSSLILAMPLSDPGNTDATTWKDISADIKGSGSNKAVTRTGTSTQYSTAHSRLYGASTVFDNASSQNLNIPYSSDFDFTGDQDFCIEGWFNATTIVNSAHLFSLGTSSAFQCNINIIEHTGYPGKCFNFESPNTRVRSNDPIVAGVWYHFACVSDGGTQKMYINGKLQDSTGDNNVGTSDTVMIGRGTHYNVDTGWKGHLQDFRIYRNKKYSANFTPPTRNDWTVTNLTRTATGLTADAGGPIWKTNSSGSSKTSGTNTDSFAKDLVFALPMDGSDDGTTIEDETDTIKGSGSPTSVTVNGNAVTSTDQSKWYGSSGYFPGAQLADSLTVSAGIAIGSTDDFTIEYWYYQTGQPQTVGSIIRQGGNSGSDIGIAHWGGNYALYPENTSTGISTVNNTWTHVAWVRKGAHVKLYVNGQYRWEDTDYTDVILDGSKAWSIASSGTWYSLPEYYQGYLSDLRIYKAVKYESNFVPSASSGTLLGSQVTDSPMNYAPTDDGDTGVGGEVRGNYCIWNLLDKSASVALSDGNLKATESSGSWTTVRSTMAVNSGKWYAEWVQDSGGTGVGFGVSKQDIAINTHIGSFLDSYMYYTSGTILRSSNTHDSYGASFTVGDVIGCGFDYDNGKLYFYKNGTSQGAYTISGGCSGFWAFASSYISASGTVNFGQRAFKYTNAGTDRPSTDYKCLCSQNLPDTFSGDELNNPSKYFDVKTWTGDGLDNRNIGGLGFQPDLVWLKLRETAADGYNYNHNLYDAVRGAGHRLEPNDTATSSSGQPLDQFNSDGFRVDNNTQVNESGKDYVSWNWDCGTSASGANNDGSINVSSGNQWKNATAGFSITKYLGDAQIGATVGHGLSAPPEFVIIKNLDSTTDWEVYTKATGNTKSTKLNLTDATSAADAGYWNNTSPSNTVFTLSNSTSNNGSGDNYMAYCWAPIAGYSAFGLYTGNGNNAGPFVYTGFKPRWYLMKETNDATNWLVYDSERDVGNPTMFYLFPNSNAGGNTYDAASTDLSVDFLSNGFKIRNSNSGTNASNQTYLWAAFAEHPFKTARAR